MRVRHDFFCTRNKKRWSLLDPSGLKLCFVSVCSVNVWSVFMWFDTWHQTLTMSDCGAGHEATSQEGSKFKGSLSGFCLFDKTSSKPLNGWGYRSSEHGGISLEVPRRSGLLTTIICIIWSFLMMFTGVLRGMFEWKSTKNLTVKQPKPVQQNAYFIGW